MRMVLTYSQPKPRWPDGEKVIWESKFEYFEGTRESIGRAARKFMKEGGIDLNGEHHPRSNPELREAFKLPKKARQPNRKFLSLFEYPLTV